MCVHFLRKQVKIVKIKWLLLAMLLAWSLGFSWMAPDLQGFAARAAQSNEVTPQIVAFNVDEVPRLAPGVELNFDIYGTPGGQATLRIEGAARSLTLVEREAGQYEGTYTISVRDKIAARSPVTANLRVGNQVASALLNESLQIGVGAHPVPAGAGPQPRIERFHVDPVAELGAGNELSFTLFGTPGAAVDLAITGVKGKVLLSEVGAGQYAGTYTIRRSDHITAGSGVTANLRVGDRVTSSTLAQSLHNAAAPTHVRSGGHCDNCGTVEAVNLVEVKGQGGYLGAIGGGVAGALVGSEVGSGGGRTAAQIAGALGGAYLGREIEARARKSQHYEVVVRLYNGTAQTFAYTAEPGLHVGDKVEIRDGVVVPNPRVR